VRALHAERCGHWERDVWWCVWWCRRVGSGKAHRDVREAVKRGNAPSTDSHLAASSASGSGVERMMSREAARSHGRARAHRWALNLPSLQVKPP
jgi:hypothetical protein